MQILFDESEFVFASRRYEGSEEYLSFLNETMQKIIKNEQAITDEQSKKDNEYMKNSVGYRIQRISEVVNHTKNDRLRLGYAKHIYSDMDFDKLYTFADAFSYAVSYASDQNITTLTEAQKAFEEAKILEKMEELLKLQ